MNGVPALFDEKLHCVGDRLQDAVPADAARRQPHLHEAEHLALDQSQVANPERQDGDDQQDLNRRNDDLLDERLLVHIFS
jgi:hypothetical protein